MNDNKTVLITGATGGLGQSIADEFYEKEFRLILTGTNDAKLDALQSKFIRDTKIIKCNLAKTSEINEANHCFLMEPYFSSINNEDPTLITIFFAADKASSPK